MQMSYKNTNKITKTSVTAEKKNKEKRLLKLSSVFSVIILPNYTDFFVADYHTMFLSRVCKAMHKI